MRELLHLHREEEEAAVEEVHRSLLEGEEEAVEAAAVGHQNHLEVVVAVEEAEAVVHLQAQVDRVEAEEEEEEERRWYEQVVGEERLVHHEVLEEVLGSLANCGQALEEALYGQAEAVDDQAELAVARAMEELGQKMSNPALHVRRHGVRSFAVPEAGAVSSSHFHWHREQHRRYWTSSVHHGQSL